jgi:hypothetical protein
MSPPAPDDRIKNPAPDGWKGMKDIAFFHAPVVLTWNIPRE